MARRRNRTLIALVFLAILVFSLRRWFDLKSSVTRYTIPAELQRPLPLHSFAPGQAIISPSLRRKVAGRKSKNTDTLARLIECRRSPGLPFCTSKDKNVVLLGTAHFVRVVERMFDKEAKFPAGEGIWADALLWALDQLGYPYLIIGSENHNETNSGLRLVYELIGEDVSMVLGDFLSVSHCIKDGLSCLKTDLNPNGIPSHKLFVFDGMAVCVNTSSRPDFPSSAADPTPFYIICEIVCLGFAQDIGHPLGRQWHLTFYPNEEKGFTYLGLTIENYCHKFGVVPAAKRFNKIYVLGKDRAYLHPPAPQLFDPSLFVILKNATGVSFTIGTNLATSDLPIWPGLTEIGTMSRDSFIYQLQHHRALIGIGWPVQSSTPLEALCVGTPFINPVWLGRRSQKNRSKWNSQHPYLAHLDPPYVYNVQDHRVEDVLQAIREILKRPLTESFIPEDMKKEVYLSRCGPLLFSSHDQYSLVYRSFTGSVSDSVEALITKDWEAAAAASRFSY